MQLAASGAADMSVIAGIAAVAAVGRVGCDVYLAAVGWIVVAVHVTSRAHERLLIGRKNGRSPTIRVVHAAPGAVPPYRLESTIGDLVVQGDVHSP